MKSVVYMKTDHKDTCINRHKLQYKLSNIFFLRNKHTNTYIQIVQTLHNTFFQIMGNEINFINFYADFEKTAHNAVMHVFPK
jgi:hypothetical protein